MTDRERILVANLLKAFLPMAYDDLNEKQMQVVAEAETEIYKKHIDELRATCPLEEIKNHIHDWWLDYEISDKTEDMLLEYLQNGVIR